MSEEGGPGKAEMQELFRRLRNIPANRVCFDCSAKNPTWASVTYGVFICIDCSAVHRSLGVHLSFVRSTQLDTNWTWTQLRNMQLGGNANASAFFSQHNCTSTDSQQKYNSRAAHLYREKLNQNVIKYNKIHGNKILLDSDESKSPTPQDGDFFKEMHSAQEHIETLTLDNSTRLTKNYRNGAESNEVKDGPNVTAALAGSVSDTSAPRKSTIGQRKPGGMKLGAKKVGLGVQKVKTDFSEIEKEAQMLDQMKERREEDAKLDAERRAKDEEKQLASARLAYQDLSNQQKKRDEQLKHLDPKKAQQVERLGMGIGVRAGVSHSAISDMVTFDQETPDCILSQPSVDSYSSSSRGTHWDYDRPAPSKSFEDDMVVIEHIKPKSTYSREPRESRDIDTSSQSDEAVKKFGNAKAISSDQYFSGSKDNDYETRTNLSRFEGQSSISSADYFGEGHARNQGQSSRFQSSLQNVDLDDVKESVKQGVTKVAGRLSNIANGVMSSLQEKYGY